jgi:opacity protein-like surface antigen
LIRSWTCLGIVVALLSALPTASDAFDKERKGFILGFGLGPSVSSFTQEFSYDWGNNPPPSSTTNPSPARLPVTGNASSDRIKNFGVATSLKIGWGLSEQLLVYYIAQVAWFRHDDIFAYDDPATDFKDYYWADQGFDPVNTLSPDQDRRGEAAAKAVWLTHAVGGLGITYYLGSTSPWYVSAAGGFSAWTAPFENDDWLIPFMNHSQTWFGYGASFGVGYEIFNNWTIEATGMWGNPHEKGDIGGLEVNTSATSFQILFNGLIY